MVKAVQFSINCGTVLRAILRGIIVIIICGTPGAVQAGLVADPANDFIPTFLGPQNGDLDVLGVEVEFDGTNFLLHAVLNGLVGTTPGGFYVWGVNRGGNGQGFPTIAPGVLFDRVVVINSDGTGTVAGSPLPSVTISGNEIFGTVPLANLPSTGFAPLDYTWNLWPRSPAIQGNPDGNIADFAPDNSNINVTAVPEPSTGLLAVTMGIGLAVCARLRRRVKAAAIELRQLE